MVCPPPPPLPLSPAAPYPCLSAGPGFFIPGQQPSSPRREPLAQSASPDAEALRSLALIPSLPALLGLVGDEERRKGRTGGAGGGPLRDLARAGRAAVAASRGHGRGGRAASRRAARSPPPLAAPPAPRRQPAGRRRPQTARRGRGAEAGAVACVCVCVWGGGGFLEAAGVGWPPPARRAAGRGQRRGAPPSPGEGGWEKRGGGCAVPPEGSVPAGHPPGAAPWHGAEVAELKAPLCPRQPWPHGGWEEGRRCARPPSPPSVELKPCRVKREARRRGGRASVPLWRGGLGYFLTNASAVQRRVLPWSCRAPFTGPWNRLGGQAGPEQRRRRCSGGPKAAKKETTPTRQALGCRTCSVAVRNVQSHFCSRFLCHWTEELFAESVTGLVLQRYKRYAVQVAVVRKKELSHAFGSRNALWVPCGIWKRPEHVGTP